MNPLPFLAELFAMLNSHAFSISLLLVSTLVGCGKPEPSGGIATAPSPAHADDHQWVGVFESCSDSGELTFSTPPESTLRITLFQSSIPAIPYWKAIPAGTKVTFRGRLWDAGSGYVAVDHQTGKKRRLSFFTLANAVPVTLPSDVDEKLVRLVTTFDIYHELGRTFSLSTLRSYRENSFQSLDEARENASGPQKNRYPPDIRDIQAAPIEC